MEASNLEAGLAAVATGNAGCLSQSFPHHAGKVGFVENKLVDFSYVTDLLMKFVEWRAGSRLRREVRSQSGICYQRPWGQPLTNILYSRVVNILKHPDVNGNVPAGLRDLILEDVSHA